MIETVEIRIVRPVPPRMYRVHLPVKSGSAFPVATMATPTTPRITAQVRTNLNRNEARAARWAVRICSRIGGSASGAAVVTLEAIT